MRWFALFLTIAIEVAGTTLMKQSDGFQKPLYGFGALACYAASLTLLTFVSKQFEISVVYAVWSGVGIAAISVVGVVFFGESMSAMKVLCLLLITAGVIGLNFS